MTEENSQKDLTEKKLTELISKVDGVLDSRVLTDEKNYITEIYVLADKSRGAKQIVRDIETAVAVKYNCQLDHRKISVVQLNDSEETFSKSDQRIILKNLVTEYTEYNDNMCKIEVELQVGDDVYQGTATGPGTLKNQNRLVAKSVLEAIKKDGAFEAIFSFVLEEVSVVNFSGEYVVMVAVTLVRESSEELLIGASVVRKDVKEAVARATLDAVNRRITYL